MANEQPKSYLFSDEEMALIVRALGIAEYQAMKAAKEWAERLITVRGVEDQKALRSVEVDPMLNTSYKFADLSAAIRDGQKTSKK